MFERQITNRFLAALDHIQYGAITVTTPDGNEHAYKSTKPGAEAHIDIHDWDVVSAMLRNGDIGLAESYRSGLWDSPDLAQLILFCLQNHVALDNYIYGNTFGRLAARGAYLLSSNTVRRSKKNIQAHYDIGNDFYKLWLDPSMTYSSALFDNEAEQLQSAQLHKYDRMIDRMKGSGNLLEIGCGWGGFAERALQKGDYRIKGLTISKAQHEYASQRLGADAEIAMEDYRAQSGLYDQIVSIEMFEAVGEKFWPVYFTKLKSLLANQGKAIVQTITIGDEYFDRYRLSGDAIRTFIFPGGMLPSPSRFRFESTMAGLRVTDEFNFGQHYAKTLEHWLKNFDHKIQDIKALGFDHKFIRMWRFYLTCCIATFRHGRTDVMQWELQHAA